MAKRLFPILLIVLSLATFGLFVSVPPIFAIDPISIACPPGQTVWLTGSAAPDEALLIYLSGRAVGGGSADRAGNWRLPLRANERPGIYDVEVRGRASRLVIGRFSCYVNVVLDTAVTLTPGAQPSTLPTLITVSQSPTPTRSATPTTIANNATPSATSSSSSGTTPSATTSSNGGTGGTTTATPSITATIDSSEVSFEIYDVILSDPDYPDETDYIEIINNSESAIDIAGWRVMNSTRSDKPSFTFPSLSVDAGASVILFGGSGDNDLDGGIFYWNRGEPVWRDGDTAVLYKPGTNGPVASRCKIDSSNSGSACDP